MKVYTVRHESLNYSVNEAFTTKELAEEMVNKVGVGYIEEYEVKEKTDDKFLFVVIFNRTEQETRLVGSYEYSYPTIIVVSPFDANIVLWASDIREATKKGTEILINFLKTKNEIATNYVYNADTFKKVDVCHSYRDTKEFSELERKILIANILKDDKWRYQNAIFVALFSCMDDNKNVKVVCDAEEVGQIFSSVTSKIVHIYEKDRDDFISEAKKLKFDIIEEKEYEFTFSGDNAIKNLDVYERPVSNKGEGIGVSS